MKYYEVAPTQIVRSGADSFTYASEQPLEIGQLVRISVGKKLMNGLVVKLVSTAPDYSVKPIESILEDRPVPQSYVGLARWLSSYYMTPLAVVLQTLLPRGLHKKRRQKSFSSPEIISSRTNIVLNGEQQSAIDTINNASPGTILLHGITGSGKTAVYIELAKQSVNEGKSAVILVPEIALTSQLVSEFNAHFKDVVLTHSRQTESERHAVWREVLMAEVPQVIIGPRSALFLPVQSLGLIAIDEAHEPSYKQEQSPRYHALRAAHFLAEQSKAKLILGSATPSVVDYYLDRKSVV
jgi:primosomal protein N' (replication factor Y)